MNDKLAMLESYRALAHGLASPESLAALTNSRGGLACSAHPANITVGSCLNPQLGAAVLFGKEDLDFALPGALPVVWQRQYSSRINPEHGAACGLLGHGWHLSSDIRLELRADRVLLFDAAGRVITFQQFQLKPGEQRHSPSENIWLLRGGKDAQGYPPAWSRQQHLAHLSAELTGDENTILVSSGAVGIWWAFAPAPVTQEAAHQAPGKNHDPHPEGHQHHHGHDHDHDHPAEHQPVTPPPQRWRLAMQVDGLGRSQRYHYSQGGETGQRYFLDHSDDILPEGLLIGITDGIGRHYRLYHQRLHAGKPAQGLWGEDNGWRLVGVKLERDPHDHNFSTSAPVLLVRYGYDPQGQLMSVHDRTGELARQFEWHNRRISGHYHRGGPWHHYRYDGVEPDGKVIEQANEHGLRYRLDYQRRPPSPDNKPVSATVITDSLGRTETYCFEGQAGLSRLTEHRRADGTVMRYRHNNTGRLLSTTDPLERSTLFRYDLLGNAISVQQPGKAQSTRNYDRAGRLTASYDPTGAAVRCQYDDWGRRTQRTLPDGTEERYRYPDPQEQPLTCDCATQIEDARGGIRHLQYNNAGQLIGYTDPSGNTTAWDYDRWGDVVEETSPLGYTTRYERDPAGHLVAVLLPNEQIRRYQYNRQGKLARVELDQRTPNNVLQIDHDLWGRIVKTSLGGLTLELDWDEAGRLIALTNENGARSQFAWDAMNRLVQETGVDGRVRRYQWDAAGQLTQASDDGVAQLQAQPGQVQAHQYHWDEAGRLIEWQLPATQACDEQSRRYEWDPAGRLKTASVYLRTQRQNQTEEQLQSRIEIERDPAGRITGELQQLYKMSGAPAPASAPPLEYEHRIAHQFDAEGGQQESELQNVGSIQWLFDDSGQVQRLVHDGQNLVDFERNAVYREIRRQWHTLQNPAAAGHPAPLTQTSHWNSLGQLQDIKLEALPLQAIPASPVVVNQITQRQYSYDALGQLIALQTATQTLRYSYDSAGRLSALANSQAPQTAPRWDVDPAGNRLPDHAATQQQQQNWAELVHRRWKDPGYNPFAGPARTKDPIHKWQDNRIGFYQGCAWRYDEQGNRVEQIRQDADDAYSRQRLSYDGNNQLVGLHAESIDAQGDVTVLSESRYVYDALGRRLKKTIRAQGKERVSYYGWNGDQLAHTERVQEDDTRDIVHTVYEPGSFTPLIRLSTTGQGDPQAKPHLMVQAIKASVPADKRGEPNLGHALTMMQNIFTDMPERMQKKLEESLQQALGLSAKMSALPGNGKMQRTNDLIADMRRKMEESVQKMQQKNPGAPSQIMSNTSDNLLASMRDNLKEMKREEQGPVTIHYYVCDHLGTPLALLDQQGNIVWAIKLDPWGNIEEEYNPHGIEQPIRLPGQYHDLETGLYYNRHRYYDPRIGAYINQDLIGNNADINRYHYPANPIARANPLGLADLSCPASSVVSPLAEAGAAESPRRIGAGPTRLPSSEPGTPVLAPDAPPCRAPAPPRTV